MNMSNPQQRTVSTNTGALGGNLRNILTEKANWEMLSLELNLPVVDTKGVRYEQAEQLRKDIANTDYLVGRLREKGGIKPLANIERPKRTMDEYEEEEPGDGGDQPANREQWLFGTGNGASIYGESGMGAEVAVAGVRKCSDAQKQMLRAKIGNTVMVGGGAILGMGRLFETLKTKKEKNAIRAPGGPEVRRAMLRSRFPEYTVGPFGVLPSAYHLTRYTKGMMHACANERGAGTNVAIRKLLFTNENEYSREERYLGLFEKLSGLGKAALRNNRLQTNVVFTGGIGAYPLVYYEGTGTINRVRLETEMVTEQDPAVDENLVKINMHARAGPLYQHKSLTNCINLVLKDSIFIVQMMDRMNAQFVRKSMQESVMPVLEAEELMASAIKTLLPVFVDHFDRFRMSNQAMAAGALVAKTDKMPIDKYFDCRCRLYVEGNKAIQLPMAEYTQSVEELLSHRGIKQTYASAAIAGARDGTERFPKNLYLTHSALGHSFPHGGADVLWRYVTRGLDHGDGYFYMHSSDDNFIVIRCAGGMVYARFDMTDYDKSITKEVKRPIVEAIVETTFVVNPGGAALWQSENLKTILLLNGPQALLCEDMTMSGVHMFDKINDVAMEVCQSRAIKQCQAKRLAGMDDLVEVMAQVEESMRTAAEGLGMKLRVEEMHSVPFVATMTDFLREQEVQFLGYNHWIGESRARMSDQHPRSTNMVKCYLDPPRLISAMLNKSHYIKEHDEYRRDEALRLASIMITAGVPSPPWEAAFDAMRSHALKLIDLVKDMGVDTQEYDQINERAPLAAGDGTKPEPPVIPAMLPPVANTPDIQEVFRSMDGVRKALEEGPYRIWLDNGENIAFLIDRMEQDEDSWVSNDWDASAVDAYLRGHRLKEKLEEAEFNMSMYEEGAIANVPYLNIDEPSNFVPAGVTSYPFRMYDDKEIAAAMTLAKWENWGRVNAKAAVRAAAQRRRRQAKKARDRQGFEEGKDEDKVYRAHEETQKVREAARSLREAAEDDDYEFGEYSAAKRMGANPRKKK